MHGEGPFSGVVRRNWPHIYNRVPVKCPVWQTDNDLSYRKITGKFPVEAMPTPDNISYIHRYFQKIVVFIRKKPCTLAGVQGAGKIDAVQHVFRNTCQPDTDMAQKYIREIQGLEKVFFKRKIRKSAATLCLYGIGKDVCIGERA
jgi:hypothetical protein